MLERKLADEMTMDEYEREVRRVDRLAERLLKIAESSDNEETVIRAIREIVDRTEGKPKQSTDITSKGEKIVMPILGGESQLSTDDKDNE